MTKLEVTVISGGTKPKLFNNVIKWEVRDNGVLWIKQENPERKHVFAPGCWVFLKEITD